MSQKIYDTAVIGVGRIGMSLEQDPKRLKPATHFGMWRDHPRTNLIAVCDPDPAKLKIAEMLLPGIKTYTDAATLLREINPDAISIATWKDSHYHIMDLALNHGVPAVVLEKPIAERIEHAREIVRRAHDQGMHLLINHRRRFDPLLYPLIEEMKTGLIGEMLQVTTYYVFGLVTTGTHLIDTLRFFLADTAGEIEWVSALPNAFDVFAPDDDPCVDGILGFANGLKATVQSLNMKDYDLFELTFFGRKGKVSLKNVGRDIEIYMVEESAEHEGFTELSAVPLETRGKTPRNQFGLMANNVIDCLEGQATSLSTGEDSLKTLEILLAMQKSATNGGKVVRL